MKTLNRKPLLAIAASLALCVASIEAEAQILGTAETFGVLGGSAVTNTGPSVITGNLGVSLGSAVTGFPPGMVVGGTIHAGDAFSALAQAGVTTAYNTLFALPTSPGGDLSGQDLGGLVLGPAVYAFQASAQLTGTLTLDGQGNSAAQCVFKIGSTLTTASNVAGLLINGANANNENWAVGSFATLGTNTSFVGNIVALTSITLNTGASIVCGRARNGAVTLDNNVITLCAGGGDDDGDTTEDEFFGVGTAGAQQAAFGASRQFGSTMLAQAAFGLSGGGPDLTGVTPHKPMKLGALEIEEGCVVNEGYHPRTWRLWTSGFGGTSSLDGSLAAGRAEMKSITGGVGVGLDYRIDPSTLVGIAAGYTYSSFSVDQLSTDGAVEGGHAGLYALKRYGPLYVAGLVDYAHFANETKRAIDWVVDESASGEFGSDVYGARTEAGWLYSGGRHNVTPFVGLDMVSIRSDGYVEDSVGILGLTFEADRATSLTSALGAQSDTTVQLQNGQILRPFARIAWVHEFYPALGVDSLLTISPAATFAGEGIFADQNVARVNTGFGLELTEYTGLFAYFDGEFSGYSQSYAGNGGVKVFCSFRFFQRRCTCAEEVARIHPNSLNRSIEGARSRA